MTPAAPPPTPEAAAQAVRYQRWQERYDHSSRRSEVQARALAIVVLAGIALVLLMQFLSSSRVA